MDFLGHRVDSQGVRPLETKVSAIRDFPKPKTVKDLRKFLGAINFKRRFIPNADGNTFLMQYTLFLTQE